jgi:phosphate:Na+ symporter
MSGALQAFGGLGLFLLGMKVLTDGLQLLAESTVRRALARFTRSPTSGAATGAIMTVLVQSSSVTTVAAVGFVGAGLLSFPQALGVIFGANAGTTITGWIVALVGFKFDLGAALVPLMLPAILVHLLVRGRIGAIGLAVCGFSLVFLGLDLLKGGLAGLAGVITPDVLPGDGVGGRLALVGIGALITVMTQSSSAGVAAAIAAVHGGAIELTQAAAMVIGMDVGTTITAALATVGSTTQARRTGYAHVIYNLITAVGAFLILPLYFLALGSNVAEPELALVGFHTLFNSLGVIAVLPVTGKFAALMSRLVPEREQPWAQHLTPALLNRPAAALDSVLGAVRQVVRMSCDTIADGLDGRRRWDEALERIDECALAVDAIHAYLDQIQGRALDAADRIRHQRILHIVDHLLRMATRCRRRASESSSWAPLEETRTHVAGTLRAANGHPDEALEKQMDAWRRALLEQDEAFRHDVLERSATGSTTIDEALAGMNESRFLRRLTHHTWRITHHLRALDAATADVAVVPGAETDWDE